MGFKSQRDMVQGRKSVHENWVQCRGLVIRITEPGAILSLEVEVKYFQLCSLEAKRGNQTGKQFLVPRKKVIET